MAWAAGDMPLAPSEMDRIYQALAQPSLTDLGEQADS